jgi:putative thioredoxin
MTDVTDATFNEEVMEKSKNMIVVVDFWAPWCPPCQILKPIMEKLAGEYEEKAAIVKVNVEDNKKTANDYGIMSIPAVKMFKDGKIIDEFMGAKPEEEIKGWIDSHL